MQPISQVKHNLIKAVPGTNVLKVAHPDCQRNHQYQRQHAVCQKWIVRVALVRLFLIVPSLLYYHRSIQLLYVGYQQKMIGLVQTVVCDHLYVPNDRGKLTNATKIVKIKLIIPSEFKTDELHDT